MYSEKTNIIQKIIQNERSKNTHGVYNTVTSRNNFDVVEQNESSGSIIMSRRH